MVKVFRKSYSHPFLGVLAAAGLRDGFDEDDQVLQVDWQPVLFALLIL